MDKYSKTPDIPVGMRTLFDDIIAIKDTERLLIVTDDRNKQIADYIYKYASVYFDTTMCMMKPRTNHGENPTDPICAAMANCDVALGVTTYSLFHCSARTTNAKENGLRWVSMQNYTMDMFTDSGLCADFGEVRERVDRVGNYYFGKTYHVTTPGGTDLVCSVEGRDPVLDYGTSTTPGAACGTPSAEIALGPVEGTSEGTIVVDGSIPFPGIDLITEPIVMKVEKGMVVDIKGGEQAELLKNMLASYNDPSVYTVAELGLGLNHLCRLRGVMAEDEGSYGDMHIAIGKNTTFGGHVNAPIHLDMTIKTVTIQIDDKLIMKNGVLQV